MLRIISLGLLLLVSGMFASAEEPGKEKKETRYTTKKIHDPNGIGKFYMGREIAHVMDTPVLPGWKDPNEKKKNSPINSTSF